MEAGKHDLPGTGGAGDGADAGRKGEHPDDRLDRNDLHESGDDLYLCAAGAVFLSVPAGVRRVRDQPHE